MTLSKISYEELLEKYRLLERENKELRAQINALTEKGSVSVKSKTVTDNFDNPTVTMRSTPEEKIKLFRSLFRGRDDVFARRWHSVTSDKSGYQPVCGNEWADGLCDKKKYKCAACPNRKLLSITDNDIFRHLTGKDNHARDVIGIYPLLPDETCFFLCADFDEEKYREDISAFLTVCGEYNVPVAVERSRSGNGAHIWIFFSEPILAETARKIGSGILSEAMKKRSELSFKSYDRFLPNQDTMPKGGFGNLIALPLQGLARKNGNSVFVTEDFAPYGDQWAFLSSVKKLDKTTADALAAVFSAKGELGALVSDSEDTKPWETKRKEKTNVSPEDFPRSITAVKANMLYVPSENLSAAAKNQIKRLAAFKNPDFYRAQKMRMPVYNKPRIICTADISEKYIAIPRGCEDALTALLIENSVQYFFDDQTNSGTQINVSFNGTLREEQQLAADALLKNNTGVLSATTAFGKTVIASYLISKIKTNTLILVHTASLMEQWKISLESFLTFDTFRPDAGKQRGGKKDLSPIGQIGSGKNTARGTADVAVMQSLISGNEVKEIVRNYGMVIVDECHHVPAVNFEKILSYANARFIYGLTATPSRQDGRHPIIFMQCGPVRYRVDAKEQAGKRNFDHILIPRFTAYRSAAANEKGIAEIYRGLAESAPRNHLIVGDVIEALKNGRNPIILTERKEHVALLSELLSGHCGNIIELTGSMTAKERRAAMEHLMSISENERFVVAATGKYVGEGFDFPRLDTLFLALPIAWKGKVAQYAGRLHRSYPGKTEVQIYDYADIHIPVLERMYQKRVKSYAAIGYKIKTDAAGYGDNVVPDIIHDGKSFYPIFCRDIESAKREILIVSPFMRKNRLTQIVRLLNAPVLNGVSVTVVTRPPENFKESDRAAVKENVSYLRDCGINVILKADFHQKLAVVDQNIVWYGSVNFLSFGTHEESIMRFANADLAGELIDSVLRR